jgi:thiamine biosynthesis lipoprotein
VTVNLPALDAVEPDAAPDVQRFEGRAMGSPLRMTIVGRTADAAGAAWRLVVDEFEAAEQAMSRFRETSDLTHVNRSAGTGRATAVDPRLARALAAADRAGRLTGGRFDARILADLERLGYRGADLGDRPAAGTTSSATAKTAASEDPLAATGMARWLTSMPRESSIALDCPVDLGGIGKGLALRWAWRVVERSRVFETSESGAGPDGPHAGVLLEAGGDLIARGVSPDGGPWSVGIEDPEGGKDPLAVIAVSHGAVVTSSVGVHRWRTDDGRAVHHLVDPKTGEPGGEGLLAVTVAGPDPAWAEVWSKTLFLAGADGITALARGRGLAAWWVGEHGRLEMTAAARPYSIWVARER